MPNRDRDLVISQTNQESPSALNVENRSMRQKRNGIGDYIRGINVRWGIMKKTKGKETTCILWFRRTNYDDPHESVGSSHHLLGNEATGEKKYHRSGNWSNEEIEMSCSSRRVDVIFMCRVVPQDWKCIYGWEIILIRHDSTCRPVRVPSVIM